MTKTTRTPRKARATTKVNGITLPAMETPHIIDLVPTAVAEPLTQADMTPVSEPILLLTFTPAEDVAEPVAEDAAPEVAPEVTSEELAPTSPDAENLMDDAPVALAPAKPLFLAVTPGGYISKGYAYTGPVGDKPYRWFALKDLHSAWMQDGNLHLVGFAKAFSKRGMEAVPYNPIQEDMTPQDAPSEGEALAG